jgi:CBS domain-containing protein
MLFHFENIRHLPVLENNKLVGIITATDILKAFVKLSNDIAQAGK